MMVEETCSSNNSDGDSVQVRGGQKRSFIHVVLTILCEQWDYI